MAIKLTAHEQTLLEAAAAMPAYTEGSISAIFVMSAMVGNVEVCSYIADHYATEQHFAAEQIPMIKDIAADMIIGEPLGHA